MPDTNIASRSTPVATPLAPALGARVEGVDIAGGLSEAEFQFVRDALHRYSVVVLPKQRLDAKLQAEFTSRLGPLRGKSPLNKYAHPDCLDVTIISNIVEDGRAIGISDAGTLWHTDASYMPVPDMYSMLHAVQVPQRDGATLGNTLYASAAAAYEALPDAMRNRIRDLRSVHSYPYHIEKKRLGGNLTRAPLTQAEMEELPEQRHPLVRTHPYTGRKSIYASDGHTSGIADLPESESARLLTELTAHIRKPEFVYTHRWEVGDLVIWDNCAVQHLAIQDYGTLPRRMHQSGVRGTKPV